MKTPHHRRPIAWLIVLSVGLLGCDASVPKENSTSADKTTTAGKPETATGEKRIILLTNGDSPYWDACRAGMSAANSELKLADSGLKAVMEVNDGTPQGQLQKLQQYGTLNDIAAVGVSAIDADNVAVADELRSLQKKGVKVLTIDSDLDRAKFSDARFAFIGTDNLTGGRVLGKCAKGLREDGGEYVTFVGRTGAQNAKERIGGFAEGAGDKFESKDTMADDTKKEVARENVRNAIRNHPDLKVLVGIWSYNAPAIVDVVREVDRRKDFTIVVFDAEPDAITAMKDGQIDAMVVQNPFDMGYQGVRLMQALIKDDKETIATMLPKRGEPGGDIYDTGLKVVVPENKSPLTADQVGIGVEFLELPRFQEWLTKYGLTGS
ncbi:MAG: substrate-binding domain-containing protein [Planctomycetes bacterium]|nr:substrate-binding domain-containing protein [Planctomycetota bacterium]